MVGAEGMWNDQLMCIQNLSLIYDQNAIVNCPIKLIIIHWMMLLLIVRQKSDNWVIRYVHEIVSVEISQISFRTN